MDVLCQFQADVLGVTVRRPANAETTVLGAAFLAGIAEGVWASPAEAAAAWREEAAFTPAPLPRRRATPGRVAHGPSTAPADWVDPDASDVDAAIRPRLWHTCVRARDLARGRGERVSRAW